jgi:hypothetical protein
LTEIFGRQNEEGEGGGRDMTSEKRMYGSLNGISYDHLAGQPSTKK